MTVLVNGQLRTSEEAVISVFDHGFLYGMGLFETFRTYSGKPWLLERHARRLADGCRRLAIGYEPDPARMEADIARLLAAAGLADGYVRWSVSAGEGAVGLPAGGYERPTEVVYVKPLAPDDPATRAAKTLRLLRTRRTAPEIGGPRLKSFHYMNNIEAKRELAASGASPAAEGLFLEREGHVCEGTVSNVFWVRDGKLYTPAVETGALPGITRAYVLELARSQGVAAEEGWYEPDALRAADELFVTNSVQEIVPVVRVEDADGRTVWERDAGPLTRRWMADYRRAAEKG